MHKKLEINTWYLIITFIFTIGTVYGMIKYQLSNLPKYELRLRNVETRLAETTISSEKDIQYSQELSKELKQEINSFRKEVGEVKQNVSGVQKDVEYIKKGIDDLTRIVNRDTYLFGCGE